jgi:hypothetical protein
VNVDGCASLIEHIDPCPWKQRGYDGSDSQLAKGYSTGDCQVTAVMGRPAVRRQQRRAIRGDMLAGPSVHAGE